MRFAEFLVVAKKSLVDVVRETGLSYPTLLKLKHGRGRPTIATAKRLSEYDARLDAAELLGVGGGDDEPASDPEPVVRPSRARRAAAAGGR